MLGLSTRQVGGVAVIALAVVLAHSYVTKMPASATSKNP